MEQQELISIAFKMTMALGAVLLVFGGTIFLVKKFSNSGNGFFKKVTQKTNLKPLEVLAFQSLGPGRGIYLIRCLDKKILVGSTNASIQHLSDIVEDELDDEDIDSQVQKTFQSSLKSSQNPSFEKGLKEIARV